MKNRIVTAVITSALLLTFSMPLAAADVREPRLADRLDRLIKKVVKVVKGSPSTNGDGLTTPKP